MRLADTKLERGDRLVIVTKVVVFQKLKLEDRERDK
jgi:hypothetical protein